MATPSYVWVPPPAPPSQGVLPFVSDEARSYSNKRFTINCAISDALTGKNVSQVILVSLDQLHLPLIAVIDSEFMELDPLDAADAEERAEEEKRAAAEERTLQQIDAAPHTDTPEELAQKAIDIEWIADRAEAFVAWILERNIEMLSAIGNPKEKVSVLEWVFAPDQDGDVLLRDGVTRVPLFTDRLPFSFQWCCKVFGLSPERFQHALLESLETASQQPQIRRKQTFGFLLSAAKEMS